MRNTCLRLPTDVSELLERERHRRAMLDGESSGKASKAAIASECIRKILGAQPPAKVE